MQPPDTPDLDQPCWAEARPDGSVLLAVALADIDALVPRGGAVDVHAAHDTSSVCTAAGVFAMVARHAAQPVPALCGPALSPALTRA